MQPIDGLLLHGYLECCNWPICPALGFDRNGLFTFAVAIPKLPSQNQNEYLKIKFIVQIQVYVNNSRVFLVLGL
jgi:hypothetical protein